MGGKVENITETDVVDLRLLQLRGLDHSSFLELRFSTGGPLRPTLTSSDTSTGTQK